MEFKHATVDIDSFLNYNKTGEKMKKSCEGLATYASILGTLVNEFLKDKLREKGNYDLCPSQCSLLYIVFKNGGRVQIKEIYDTLLKQKSTITEMINRLVSYGYLEKQGCTEDRRISYVIATEKAIKFKDDFDEISRNLVEKVYKGFSEEEKNELMRLIFKAIDNFS